MVKIAERESVMVGGLFQQDEIIILRAKERAHWEQKAKKGEIEITTQTQTALFHYIESACT